LEQSAVAAAAAALASQEVAEAAVAGIEDSVDEATEKANEAATAALEAAQSALEAAQDALAAAESAAEAAASASTIDPDNFATAAQGDNADTAFGWGNHASAGYAADSAVVKLTGHQTIAGTKTFSSTITGTTNTQVSLTGDQTIGGIKTFSSSPVVPNATTSTQALAFGQVSTTNAAPVKTALNASGDAPIYACRAWVNFNGTGTVAIRASGNVSSITDNSAGVYTVNFTTAMSDANFSAVAAQTTDGYAPRVDSHTTSTVRVVTFVATAVADASTVSVAIFR
jgi:hypothetical protein